MRGLWPIEKAALEAAIEDHPTLADGLRHQIAAARVASFENTGAGFFSVLSVSSDAQAIATRWPLDCAHGSVNRVEEAMGFLLYLNDGLLTELEGYCLALESTTDIDFETVDFELRPYSAA